MRHAHDRRDARVKRRDRDLRAGLERHRAMLEIEEQPIEAAGFRDLGDIDAAHEAHTKADRYFPALEALAGGIADGAHLSSVACNFVTLLRFA
jgi:hypothetical protein